MLVPVGKFAVRLTTAIVNAVVDKVLHRIVYANVRMAFGGAYRPLWPFDYLCTTVDAKMFTNAVVSMNVKTRFIHDLLHRFPLALVASTLEINEEHIAHHLRATYDDPAYPSSGMITIIDQTAYPSFNQAKARTYRMVGSAT